MDERHEIVKLTDQEPSMRQIAPILAGVVVSLVYVVAVVAVVIGVLRFTREYLRRISVQEPSPRAVLARLPFRR